MRPLGGQDALGSFQSRRLSTKRGAVAVPRMKSTGAGDGACPLGAERPAGDCGNLDLEAGGGVLLGLGDAIGDGSLDRVAPGAAGDAFMEVMAPIVARHRSRGSSDSSPRVPRSHKRGFVAVKQSWVLAK
jgi:hypothetical protein